MRGCERCRVSGWDRRWGSVLVADVLYDRDGRERRGALTQRLTDRISFN